MRSILKPPSVNHALIPETLHTVLRGTQTRLDPKRQSATLLPRIEADRRPESPFPGIPGMCQEHPPVRLHRHPRGRVGVVDPPAQLRPRSDSPVSAISPHAHGHRGRQRTPLPHVNGMRALHCRSHAVHANRQPLDQIPVALDLHASELPFRPQVQLRGRGTLAGRVQPKSAAHRSRSQPAVCDLPPIFLVVDLNRAGTEPRSGPHAGTSPHRPANVRMQAGNRARVRALAR